LQLHCKQVAIPCKNTCKNGEYVILENENQVQLKCYTALMRNLLTFDIFFKFIWRQTLMSVEHELL
jgi:hypothetical protein